MIGLSGIGFSRKPKQFIYKPRHFDPEAEQREARRRAILGDEATDGEYKPGLLIRESRMRRMQQSSDHTNRKAKSTLIRAAIFILLVVAVLFFMSDMFEVFLK